MTASSHELMDAILTIINSCGGEVDSRTKIQKYAYFLSALHVNELQRTSFSFENQGPYSREVSEALLDALSLNLISEKRTELSDCSYRHSYFITEDGKRHFSECGIDFESRKKVSSTISKIKNYSDEALKLSTSIFYFSNRKSASNTGELYQKAQAIMPECMKFRHDSERLLDDLNLSLV